MGAMTMPYTVKSATSLDGLNPGDAITANVMVSGNDVWVDNIVVTSKANGGKLTPAEKKQVNKEQNKTSKEIHHDKHNG